MLSAGTQGPATVKTGAAARVESVGAVTRGRLLCEPLDTEKPVVLARGVRIAMGLRGGIGPESAVAARSR
jgi:hypothetical protein